MTKNDAYRAWKEHMKELYPKGTVIDYCTAQYNWSCFVDSLLKNGQITDKQFNNWGNPFPVKPYKIT